MRFAKRLGWFTIGLCLSMSAWADWSVESETPLAAKFASSDTVIPELKLQGMNDLRGKHVTVFYVSGRETTVVSGRGQSLIVRSVKAVSPTQDIDPNGAATIPAISIPRAGFEAFNFVMVVAHKQDNIYIRNPDGSNPKDSRVAGNDYGGIDASNFEYERVRYYAVDRIAAIRAAQGGGDSVTLDLSISRDN